MSLFRKALGAFVEFDEQKARAVDELDSPEPGATAAAAALADVPAGGSADVPTGGSADMSADPDVQRVQQAIALLSSLPLTDIPVEKARELIVRTLQFAGMDPEMLLGSFQRAQGLYHAQIHTEQDLVASRKQVNAERLALLEAAVTEEKEQCEAELTARTGRIDKASLYLIEIEKAMAFFASRGEKG